MIFISLLLFIRKNSQGRQGGVEIEREHSRQAKWISLKERKQYVTLFKLAHASKAGM